jgi:hypothetical protein
MMGSSNTPQKPFFYAFNLDDVVLRIICYAASTVSWISPICASTWNLITAIRDGARSIRCDSLDLHQQYAVSKLKFAAGQLFHTYSNPSTNVICGSSVSI